LELLFEREFTQLSRLFGEVIDFVMLEHARRVQDYLGYWAPLFEEMADVVTAKGTNAFGIPIRPSARRWLNERRQEEVEQS